MNSYVVFKRPLLSEKSTGQREMANQYAFEVQTKATKDDIRKALKVVFGVDAVKVATLNSRGKYYRRGRHVSKPKLSKKAIVTLAEGQTIKLFDDQ